MIAPLSIPSPPLSWQSIPIDLFGLHWDIRTYALIILVGIIICTIWTSRRLTKRGGEPGVVIDFLIWAVVLGLIGARLYHVFTHPHDYFYPGANLWNVFAIWEGGNAIFGSLLGGALGVFIASKQTGVRFLSFADAVAPGLLLAQAIGRLGNYVNHELYGLPTNLPWGLQIESTNTAYPTGLPSGTLFQPLFLYEIIWNVVGVIVLLALEKKLHWRWGKMFAGYLMWYGLGRSYLESIRIDPSEYSFLGIPFNVWAAILAFVLGLVLFIVQSRRHPGLELSVYLPGREWNRSEPAVDSFDTDSDDEDNDEDDASETLESTQADAAATSSAAESR
ncbi:prolipoprotein diacylglyceryl transferase [Humibacter ginsenosidimutans]|uniref:Phosphatidylglycerol--prolipoprotein diacylglyceryl transferase n=1 Tax=Humibacter ginsenosidimutans TaxID=2599293 RepID=A0A5B8M0N4_9MICO|nr:prolipoprotein diacylglyceryl transferase [Humibacter ginsenosidimutans]QDZ13816.1 prolipoprotein diacylglyceryl transferase [Humibacter ginsenosidimutans]